MDFFETFKSMMNAKDGAHDEEEPIVPVTAQPQKAPAFDWRGDRPPNDNKSFPVKDKQGVNIEALIHALAKTDTKELDYKKLMSILAALKSAGLDD